MARPKSSEPKKITAATRLAPTVYESLEILAEKNEVTLAEVIRFLLEKSLDANPVSPLERNAFRSRRARGAVKPSTKLSGLKAARELDLTTLLEQRRWLQSDRKQDRAA